MKAVRETIDALLALAAVVAVVLLFSGEPSLFSVLQQRVALYLESEN